MNRKNGKNLAMHLGVSVASGRHSIRAINLIHKKWAARSRVEAIQVDG